MFVSTFKVAELLVYCYSPLWNLLFCRFMLLTCHRRHLSCAVGTWPFISKFCSVPRGFWDEDLTYTHFPLAWLFWFLTVYWKAATLETFSTYMLKEQIFADWKNTSILISIYWGKNATIFLMADGYSIMYPLNISHIKTSVLCDKLTQNWQPQQFRLWSVLWWIGHSWPPCQDGSCGTFLIPFRVDLEEANERASTPPTFC